MPTLTRFFLRAALAHLVLAFALALVSAFPFAESWAGAARPAYVHLLVMGWATQMIFGVAYWMFPRKQPLDLRAVPWLGWACFTFINAGVLLRAVVEPMLALGRTGIAPLVVLSAALQLAAALSFVVLAWPRVIAR